MQSKQEALRENLSTTGLVHGTNAPLGSTAQFGTNAPMSNMGTGTQFGMNAPLGSNAQFGTNAPATMGNTMGTQHHHAPTIVERVEKPVIVQETILPSERTEVQPIVHRDIEQTEVHHVLQPMRERDFAPTAVQHVTLPAQVYENAPTFQVREAPKIFSETHVAPTTREQYERAPLIEETIHKKVIEEVQPILYKEVVRPTVIEATKPIYERIVQAPVVLEETREILDLGTKSIPMGQQPMMGTRETMGTMGQMPPMMGPGVERVIVEKTTTITEQPLGGANTGLQPTMGETDIRRVL
jgi:hypothetical protein